MQVLSGETDIALGALVDLIDYSFYMTPTFWQHESVYISRLPRQVVSYGNILLPYDNLTWGLCLLTLLIFATFFLCAHLALSSPGIGHLNLVKEERLPLNFLLFSFAKFCEPGFPI